MAKIKRENKRAGERPTIFKTLLHVDVFSSEKRATWVGKYYELVQKLDKNASTSPPARDFKQKAKSEE